MCQIPETLLNKEWIISAKNQDYHFVFEVLTELF